VEASAPNATGADYNDDDDVNHKYDVQHHDKFNDHHYFVNGFLDFDDQQHYVHHFEHNYSAMRGIA
jgi:hypothetical protein